MTYVKKVIIWAVIVVILMAASFFTGRISARGGSTELETGINNLEDKLVEQADSARDIKEGLKKSDTILGEIESESQGITVENRRITGEIGDISDGLQPDIDGLQGVINGISGYID